MPFSVELKRAREEAGLTQTELAKLLSVSYSSINRYENEHHIFSRIVEISIKSFFEKRGIVLFYDNTEERSQ